jgi:hypothetical protein
MLNTTLSTGIFIYATTQLATLTMAIVNRLCKTMKSKNRVRIERGLI